jgi:hypothetical protein
MAVIVSLAFHVPQPEEMQENTQPNKPELNFKKTKLKVKKK